MVNVEQVIGNCIFPYATDRLKRVKNTGMRFAHYTSSDAVVGIVENRSIWMRNALVMNDWREVEHGLDCFYFAMNGSPGKLLEDAMNRCFPGMFQQLEHFMQGVPELLKRQTYMTSISEHDGSEDKTGRLSMWRAYGGNNGVALIVNQHPFTFMSEKLGAYSTPVLYTDRDGFANEVVSIARNFDQYRDSLLAIGKDAVISSMYIAYIFAILSTKHPGFYEEREWRIIYTPWRQPSDVLQRDAKVIGGVFQNIYKIPLINDPSRGLAGADIKGLLDRLIIGPNPNPTVTYDAFVNLLQGAGLIDAAQRVIISDIPLRR